MLSGFSECNTWECINSFAPWISAIGTVFISGMALWLTVKDKMVRVIAEFNYGLVPGNDPYRIDRAVYILSFCNIGHRSVTISNYEWRIRKFPWLWRYERSFTFPYLEKELGNYCSKLPIKLTDGENGNILHKIEFFEEIQNKNDHLFSESKYLAFYRIFTFKLVLRTTLEKNIQVNIPFKVRKHIWQRYKNTIFDNSNEN